jgi:hypothetical protein
LPPRLVGIVLEPVRGGHPQLVRNAHPGRDAAVLVGGHGLDSGRSDVDADCGGFC